MPLSIPSRAFAPWANPQNPTNPCLQSRYNHLDAHFGVVPGSNPRPSATVPALPFHLECPCSSRTTARLRRFHCATVICDAALTDMLHRRVGPVFPIRMVRLFLARPAIFGRSQLHLPGGRHLSSATHERPPTICRRIPAKLY